jgi:hypothetical protein
LVEGDVGSGGDGRVRIGEVGEQLDDLGLGVGVVKPAGANVGGVGGMIGQLRRVQLVPTKSIRNISPVS